MMKCALCGAEWEAWAGSGNPVHSGSKCPLSGLTLSGANSYGIGAINDAIEAARVDKRRPEECKHFCYCRKVVYVCPESYSESPEEPGYVHTPCCPCASFKEKKEKGNG